MTTKHTPTPLPWLVDKASYSDMDGHIKIVRATDTYWIASARVLQDEPGKATANAAFIVQAVNSHEAMRKALTKLLDARFTGGYCPWCGIAVLTRHISDPTGHYDHCATRVAQAALALTEEEA